jgi:hypothetical protein
MSSGTPGCPSTVICEIILLSSGLSRTTSAEVRLGGPRSDHVGGDLPRSKLLGQITSEYFDRAQT